MKTEEDLLEAADRADYEAIKECLKDGVSVNCGRKHRDGATLNAIARLLRTAGYCRSNTQAMKCIKLLYANGADLNYTNDGVWNPLASLYDNPPQFCWPNEKGVYNAVKFVLTHGGHPLGTDPERSRSFLMGLLERKDVMSVGEYKKFEKIGMAYTKAKENSEAFRHIENSARNPEDAVRKLEIAEKKIQKTIQAKLSEVCEPTPILDMLKRKTFQLCYLAYANYTEYSGDTRWEGVLKLIKDEAGSSLKDIRLAKEEVDKILESERRDILKVLDQKEREILKELGPDIPKRKTAGLSARLKEATGKKGKPSSQKAILVNGGNEGI